MTKKSKYDMPAVQNFAFGGIANPSQQAFLRSSDKSYLDARQKELDAFEQQRQAYNSALTKYQTEVYNPYKAQVDAYNAAAEKYNTDVYNPYKTEFQKYQEAVEAYNAGDRLTDYAGPAEPKLASEFTLTAPTQPSAFGMAAPTTPEQFAGVAPVLPFKEEEVVARQKEAASRAQKDAANRAVAVDVVSNPDQFNFGSMSVSNRFMAKGGEVMSDILAMNTETLSDEKPEEVINTDPVGTAQKYLADLSGAGKLSPTRQAIKRVKTSAGGGATADKAMQLAYEDIAKGDLGAMKDRPPAMKNTESARSQMEELARVYQIKLRAAQNSARGLSADTFGAPTLEGPTLTKSKLTKKRFNKGGEAKKPDEERAPEVTGVNRVLDFIAQRLPAEYFPTSARTLLETVQGKKEPITESNFSSEELDIIRQLIGNQKQGGDTGSVKYPDYYELVQTRRASGEKGIPVSSVLPGLLSMGDAFGNVHTTLGQFRYARDADGNLIVQDKYDFNPPQEGQKVDYAGHGPYGLIRGYAGQKVPPGKGRDVRINLGKTVNRAEGSPEEGEMGPAFVTPGSGKGRKEGPISQQLKSGEAYVNMAKGVTELPYDIAGAPVDLATMLMRPFGYSTEKPVMGSDFIKEKMTKLGVRPEPPADPTAKGFYTAGELLSNLTNPAGVTRSAVKGAQKTGEAATAVAKDFQDYNRQLTVPGASYAVRPTGSTMLSGPVGMEENVSTVDRLLKNGLANAKQAAGQNEGQAGILQDFWNKKARNYFTLQFGTPDDPIATAISKKQIKGAALDEMFPEYLIDQIAVGKTRVKEGARPQDFVGPGAPKVRFYPKYPRAMEDFTSRYDSATGIKGNLITTDPAAANPRYSSLLSEEGKRQARVAQINEQEKLLAQGVRPELINTDVRAVTASAMEPGKVIGDGTDSAKALFEAYQEAGKFKQMDEPQKTNWINQIFGEGRRMMGKTSEEIGKNLLPQNVKTAIDKGEPVYDVNYMSAPLTNLFDVRSINTYLASIPPREAANIRFEDAVKGALKLKEKTTEMENAVSLIKAGKPVADTVFSKGVSGPLLQIKEGPLEGFAWKRIEKREATLPEGAYVGHSVGGYETGGIGYDQPKRDGFNTGLWQVYTLRDNRNRPVNTIEVKMLDEVTPVVTQIKGNGRATGNVPAEKYDTAVIQFLQNYLKPAAIEEYDKFLTPLLQTYKAGLGPSPRTR